MMRYVLMIFFVLLTTYIFAQSKGEYKGVEIEVRSKNNRTPIESARVEIEGYEDTKTDPEGKAWFPKVPIGNYRLEVDARGHENYIHPNFIKVTESDNVFSIELTPLPDNTFSVRGRIIDKKNGSYIENVEVNFRSGLIEKTTKSNEWGYFDFLFQKEEVKGGDEFIVSFKNGNYEIVPPYTGGFYENHIRLETIELNKKDLPEEAEKPNFKTIEIYGKYRWTLKSIDILVSPGRESWCYDGKDENCKKYGRLYTWEAAKEACRQLGEGWRLPTEEEWSELALYYGGYKSYGFQPTQGDPKEGYYGFINDFQFALGGYRNHRNGRFSELNASGYFWTATVDPNASHRAIHFNLDKKGIEKSVSYLSIGMSCKCVLNIKK